MLGLVVKRPHDLLPFALAGVLRASALDIDGASELEAHEVGILVGGQSGDSGERRVVNFEVDIHLSGKVDVWTNIVNRLGGLVWTEVSAGKVDMGSTRRSIHSHFPLQAVAFVVVDGRHEVGRCVGHPLGTRIERNGWILSEIARTEDICVNIFVSQLRRLPACNAPPTRRAAKLYTRSDYIDT